VKAGRLSTAAGQADVVTLVLSDLGDEGWHLVASGPTLGTPPSRREAIDVLSRWRLLPLVPARVRHYLELPSPSGSYSLTTGQRWSVLLGDIRTALDGARQEALRLGAEARVVPDLLAGEARSAARRLAVAGACAGNLVRRVPQPRRLVTVFGGETTVTVKGPGRGGRNRELALATAWPIAGVPGACVLCAGTDGVDYGRDAAGAFVDDTTLMRASQRGLDPDLALMMNDSGPFFESLGDAFCPGPTATNVGDVAFVLAPHDGEPRPIEPPDDVIPIPWSL
jgi:hydroxypyruvate reductase